MGTYKKCFLGIDLGSTTVKIAIIDENKKLLFKRYYRYLSSSAKSLKKILEEIPLQYCQNITDYYITGSGKDLWSEILSCETVNEIVAQAYAAVAYYPAVKTIIEIGGQDSKFIRLQSEGSKFNILTYKMNDICAAGTGAFLDSEAKRLNVSINKFVNLAMNSKEAAQIAGRCAVFAQTDIVHSKQNGIKNKDIANGVCYSVVRNYIAQFIKGYEIELPIVFQGGVAANAAIIRAFLDELKIDSGQFLVAENYEVTGALGAALYALDKKNVKDINLNDIIQKLDSYSSESSMHSKYMIPKKNKSRVTIFDAIKSSSDRSGDIIIGIDVGSTSTCIAAIDKHERMVFSSYLNNKETLIESVDESLELLKQFLEDKSFNILGVGVTGSGREIVYNYLEADFRINEISSQTKAGIAMFPEVDTIIEIGGQDSKYIFIKDKELKNFDMNKVCAAGTGYFLQTQADKMGIDISAMSGIAEKSNKPCDLGNRCTVFMESDIISYLQKGIHIKDIVAGLSYGIVRNYIDKVISGKTVGNNILFLGGVSQNKSVANAFSVLLDKDIYVPNFNDVSCAFGVALLTKEYIAKNKKETLFKINSRNNFIVKNFQCTDCTNQCMIEKHKYQNLKTVSYSGGICGKYEYSSKHIKSNLINKRNNLMLKHIKNFKYDKKVGIPRCHLTYDIFPLLSTFFQSLNIEVVLSDTTDNVIANTGSIKTLIDNCHTCKIVYGHVENLIKKGVDFIFMPSIIEFIQCHEDIERNYICPHIQELPSLIQRTFVNYDIEKIRIRRIGKSNWQEEFMIFGIEKLNFSKKEVKYAINEARKAQDNFYKEKQKLFNKNIVEPIVVLLGRSYNIYDSYLNSGIVNKFLQLGIKVAPFDILPLENQYLSSNYQDMVWECGQEIVRAAKYIINKPNLFPVFITNFGCGPDSFIIKYLERIFSEKLFLTLEIDEHSSDLGLLTRMEAFVQNIRNSNRSSPIDINFNNKINTYICSSIYKNLSKLLYVPWGFDSYRAIEASFNSIGIETKMLPKHDEITEYYAKKYSNGKECLPYIMHCGDTVRMTLDKQFNPDNSAIYMPASDLACRVSLFPSSIRMLLDNLGYPQIPVIAPRLSMDKDESMKQFGIKFTKNVFKGMLAIEILSRYLTQLRPYEKNLGETDKLYDVSLDLICDCISNNSNFIRTLKKILEEFNKIELSNVKNKPLIGLIGDDYTRGNEYANNYFIRGLEKMGCEVMTMPIWSTFFEFEMNMKPIHTLKRKKYYEYLLDRAKLLVGKRNTRIINEIFNDHLKNFPDATFLEMVEQSENFIDKYTEPLILMSLSHANKLLHYGVDGVANLVGFQCMIHSITTNINSGIFFENNIPFISLCYDFQEKVHHNNRIEAFIYQVKQNKDI